MDSRDQELKALRDQVDELQHRIKHIGKVEGEVARDQVREYLDNASTSMKQYIDQTSATLKDKMANAGDATKRAGEKAGTYASENPWHVAALGVIAGMVLGGLMGRDRR